PCRDDSRIVDHVRSIQSILLQRHQLNGTPALARRFFLSTQTGINQRKDAKCRAEIRLRLYDFLLFWANRGKRSACLCFVFHHTGKQAAAKGSIELGLTISEGGIAKCR